MRFSLIATTALSAAVLSGLGALALGTPATAQRAATRAQYGTFGFDTAGMDRSVQPGDDFYQFASGTWSRTTPIPNDKSNYGLFNALADLSSERTRTILEGAARDRNSRIGRAYATFLDQPAIERAGMAPITPWLNQIKGLTDKAGYDALLAQADRNGVPSLFANFVGIYDKNPEAYALNLSQAGIGLPDRDYYLSAEPRLVAARTAYAAHLKRVLELANEPNAEARANAIVAFETRIARGHWTRIDSRDADKTYNKVTIASLAQTAPGFDFAGYFQGIGAGRTTDVIVAQPSAITAIAAAVQETPVQVLRDQLIVRSLDSYASVLPSAFDREAFAFYGTTLAGTPQQEVRWKRAVTFVTNAVSDEVSQVYVARYFPPATKAAADRLVRNIVEAMGRRLDALEWMAPETKARARAKLAAFTPKIGYPDRWRDYSALEIRSGDALGNMIRANNWAHDDNLRKLGQPIQRWEWFMTPMTVNAYAYPPANEIVFPAAILQPPFFDPNADPAVNYGGIGAVIGHEISHHFDDQGRKYNERGALADWWTQGDVERFTQRTAQLVAQYDAYEGLPGIRVKGALTLGENIADLAGLTVAYDAYHHAYPGAGRAIGGFSPDQRFYLGWAQIWRRNYREAELRNRLLTDPHSPSRQRAWVVRNLDPWYAAFNPTAQQRLYLAQQARVRIW